MAASKQLTPKQLHFARCVATGMAQSAAYREAYTCKPGSKPATQQVAASALMANPMISSRVARLIRDHERGLMASTLSDKEKVLRKLRDLLENAEGLPGEANKLRAADLLGKTVGLFKDVQVTESPRSADEVLAELEQRLDELGQLQDGDDTDDVTGPAEEIVPSDGQVH